MTASRASHIAIYSGPPLYMYSTVHWKCKHKNKLLLCKAGIVDRNNGYVRTPSGNSHEHVCQPDLTKVKLVKMRTRLLNRGLKEQLTSASILIDDKLLEDNDLVACIPNKKSSRVF